MEFAVALSILFPSEGFLPLDEVITILQSEFSCVIVSKEEGKESVDKELAYLKRLKSKGKSPMGRDIQADIAYIESLRDEAFKVTIADDKENEDCMLVTTLMPNRPISFSYYSQFHQSSTEPLLNRVANALGYELEE